VRGTPKLLGVDVGFSATRASTGIAVLDGDRLAIVCARTSWENRRAQIPPSFRAEFIALDGPVVPGGADEQIERSCERTFVRAPFDRRCKLALSHWGSGLQLKRAAADACVQFGQTLANPRIRSGRRGPIVEAFPNAFLAVVTPEQTLKQAPKLARGRRFDWLYDQIARNGQLELAIGQELRLPDVVWRAVRVETHHDKRAALICLLTAACAARGTAAMIGEATGGWLCLPSCKHWQPWALEGLERAADAIAARGYRPLDPREGGVLTASRLTRSAPLSPARLDEGCGRPD
jgi:hypothetical protein